MSYDGEAQLIITYKTLGGGPPDDRRGGWGGRDGRDRNGRDGPPQFNTRWQEPDRDGGKCQYIPLFAQLYSDCYYSPIYKIFQYSCVT